MQTFETGSFHAFVRRVLDSLTAADITYLIGGAVALAAWGDPRTTRDLDLVIELPFAAMAAFSDELAQRGMWVPVENMVDLMLENRADLPLNAIDMNSGYKAEFFLLKSGDALRTSSLARRQRIDLGPQLGEVYVHTPEDLILNKLHYYRISQQPKHVRDIAGIVLNLGQELDCNYMDQWAQSLGLLDAWQEVQKRIAELRDEQP